ncbi:MAG TPA: hypothetical protein VEU97_13285 [Ktedonobacteraceae bacterium]|nr:hypothetical protein [Ktedonobacteraceae bacterium]
MHWKPEHVNPMLLLRNAVCNDRWEETWQGRMKQAHQSRKQEREHHTQARVERATLRLLPLLLLLSLSRPHPQEQTLSPVSLQASVAPTPLSPALKGRTEAQKRWGRRPFSPRGFRLQAEFAKQ